MGSVQLGCPHRRDLPHHKRRWSQVLESLEREIGSGSGHKHLLMRMKLVSGPIGQIRVCGSCWWPGCLESGGIPWSVTCCGLESLKIPSRRSSSPKHGAPCSCDGDGHLLAPFRCRQNMRTRRAICSRVHSYTSISKVHISFKCEAHSKTHPTPTQETTPLVSLALSKVLFPPSLNTTCVIPILLVSSELPFQFQVLTHRAPI